MPNRLRPFHVIVQAYPAATAPSQTIQLHDQAVNSLPANQGVPFDRSFETVADQLEALPRMFFELDGSFVWVTDRADQRSQLDGLLADNGQTLLHAELTGDCEEAVLDEMLQTLGWPELGAERQLVFQLVEQGLVLSEADFRRAFRLDG